jgi:hypothetical protein
MDLIDMYGDVRRNLICYRDFLVTLEMIIRGPNNKPIASEINFKTQKHEQKT